MLLKSINHRQSPVTLSNLYGHRGQNLKYPSCYIYMALGGRMIAADGLGGIWKEAVRWVTAPSLKVASLWGKNQNMDFSKWKA